MSKTYTVHVPAGNSLEMITDALSSGFYQQLANPGSPPNKTVALAANADVTVGPFDAPYNYYIQLNTGDSCTVKIMEGRLASVPAIVQNEYIYNASGAITIQNGIAAITKSSAAAAMTLAAPTAAQEGIEITIISETAKAHTVTATSLLDNGASGSPYSTATFAAYVGANIKLKAVNLVWVVISSNNVTLS